MEAWVQGVCVKGSGVGHERACFLQVPSNQTVKSEEVAVMLGRMGAEFSLYKAVGTLQSLQYYLVGT